ncbi:MAG: L,D-transpeptidase family protein [Sphingobium sp.]|jgi:murein L,D-transpeptidase YcbB/YkuD|nr:L,D-transpeptidase family protein [Sphingobium sp.]MCI1270699.1 L,D-transpeptidase family protein [Sphingobium sp.]MCI2053484.1 L,D-transpeptidase family protein [Sphingobium sp.]
MPSASDTARIILRPARHWARCRVAPLVRLGLLCCALLMGASVHAQLPAPAPVPHWTPAQVERLIQWLDFARDDALSVAVSEGLGLRAAQASGDSARIDAAATHAAAKLLDGFYRGCCDASLRDGWHIAGDRPAADPRALIADALARNQLDRLFIDAEPHHPFYRALRRAYAKEADPARRAALAANMDRWRWMPRDLGRRYLLVNAASFEAMLWQDGKLAGRWEVIVGKTKSPTPIFAAKVTGVVINPWWEIPSSIAAEGISAMVRRNPAAAAKRGYVYQNGRYRQKPGPANALGRMKLVMPNPYDVYLHDTPSQGLFDRDVRAFSHGCVRVGAALDLAAALLGSSGWDRARIDAAVAAGETQTVPLAEPIPVYIAYFTAEPDEDGAMRYFPDIYGRDTAAVSPDSGKPCGV